MLNYTLSTAQLAELRAAHRRTRDQREADRIKAVVSLVGGWPAEQVAKVLLTDSNTVREHFRRYQQGGLPGLLHMAYQGSDCALTDTDLVALDVHVQAHLYLYLTAKDVAAWGENDVICFMDAVHPQHNPVLGYGWIKRGEDHQVKSNTGRRRVNINGAIDLELRLQRSPCSSNLSKSTPSRPGSTSFAITLATTAPKRFKITLRIPASSLSFFRLMRPI